MTGREKEVVRHLSEEDLERLLTETDDVKVHERLVFIKRLYKGATLAEGEDEYRALLDDLFDQLTEKLSFAASWIDNHLDGFLNKIR